MRQKMRMAEGLYAKLFSQNEKERVFRNAFLFFRIPECAVNLSVFNIKTVSELLFFP